MRALGAYLDAHDAERISLIETPDGFAVRYSRAGSPHLELVQFGYADLITARQRLERRRPGATRTALRRHTTAEASVRPQNYQNLLRALGWELDDGSAFNILLEELNDSVLVTYGSIDPQSGYMWQKRSVNLGLDEQRRILLDAGTRRGASTRPRAPQQVIVGG